MTKTSFISEQSGATMGNSNDFLRTDLIISGHIWSRFNNCFSSAFDLIVPQLIYTFLVIYTETIQEGKRHFQEVSSDYLVKRISLSLTSVKHCPELHRKKSARETEYHLERQDKNRLVPALPCCLCTLLPLKKPGNWQRTKMLKGTAAASLRHNRSCVWTETVWYDFSYRDEGTSGGIH